MDGGQPAHLVVEHLHELYVERLEAVAGRIDEIETAVNAIVHNVAPIQTRLVLEVLLKLVVYVLNDWLETVCVINGVSEPRCI